MRRGIAQQEADSILSTSCVVRNLCSSLLVDSFGHGQVFIEFNIVQVMLGESVDRICMFKSISRILYHQQFGM